MVEVKAAATVILVRDGSTGLEVLLLKRPQHGAFANAWVYPGGRVEVEDVKDDDAAELDVARNTGERETLEETGLVVRAADLRHLCVWLPPSTAPIRFHTWFFIGAAPAHQDVQLPEGEIVEYMWLSPAEAIERHRLDELDLMPPTFVTMSGLVEFSSVDQALESAPKGEPPLFSGHMLPNSDPLTMVWDGDEEHPESEHTNGRHRLRMGDRPWVYEKSAD